MKKLLIVIVSVLLMQTGVAWAQTSQAADEPVTVEATKVDDAKKADVPKKATEAEVQADQKDEGVTLAAQKVDPKTIAQASSQTSQTPSVIRPKKKKKIPIYLQPFEFVASAIVHAVCFWDKGD